MDLRVLVEAHQGATYEQQLALARASEELGYSGFFRTEHFLPFEGDGLPGPTDAWVTLGALARETSTIRLGTMMTCGTLREPALLAVIVAQVDEMSHGRIDFGFAPGWFEPDHLTHGVRFPPIGERFDRFEEQLEIFHGLWNTPAGERFTYQGKYYQLIDNPALPRPFQDGGPPILMGGRGRKRLPHIAARHAVEFNSGRSSPEESGTSYERVRQACIEIGRDPKSITFSNMIQVVCGRNDAELARRLEHCRGNPAHINDSGIGGTPDYVIERLQAFAAAGTQRVYMHLPDVDDLDHAALIASEVRPHV